MDIEKIATVYTDFPDKFGIPRQSRLVDGLAGRIVMEKEYRRPEAFRELDGYSHIWLIWGFSKSDGRWQPTVRPPRLGGNRRVGVFASRSPFRPNGLALSSVKLISIDWDCEEAPVLYVEGVDMVSGSPIYDIKPYAPHSDCIPDARGGFSAEVLKDPKVDAPEEILAKLPEEMRQTVKDLLAQDPAPHYQDDEDRVYGFEYAGYEIKFRRADGVLVLTDVSRAEPDAAEKL